MSIQIVVPEMGESIVEATVAAWLKQEGDHVAAGEAVVELETEKVNLEVVAERAGVLARIERKAGEDVKIGDVLGVIDESAQDGSSAPARPEATPASAAAPPSSGAMPAEGIAKTLSEKELRPAPEKTGRAISDRAGHGQETGPNVMRMGSKPATPLAKRVAEEQGIDLAQVPAKGPGGRVTKEDVESYLQGQQPGQEDALPAPAPEIVTAAPAPPIERPGREERVRMSRRRQTIARRLLEATQTTAMLTTFNEVNMSAVMDIRRRRKDSFKEQHGVSLGFMSFFVKATVGALKAFPRLNAEIQGDEIVLKRYYDIGIAVGATEGLVVPVLRDADRLAFAEIERAIKAFVQKSETNSFSLEELRGGTFTITNGGVFGSLLSTPILNPPQVGILGLHKIEDRPIARNGEVVIAPMMYVALSYDHRIVDGREAVLFLVRVKELIEDPESLLLEG